MAWRLAHSLSTLRSEVNAWAPRRSKRSDGTLGDPAHASRASRHNPNRAGVVCAIDITHDPAGGCDIHAFARRHVRSPHPNLEYVISNGEIAKRKTGFRWEKYRGANKHDKHAHFAVGQGPDSDPRAPYDSTAPWGVAFPTEADDVALTKGQEKALELIPTVHMLATSAATDAREAREATDRLERQVFGTEGGRKITDELDALIRGVRALMEANDLDPKSVGL